MIHAIDDDNRIQDPEGKVAPDEPVFLVRAADKVGPAAVRAWAELNLVAGGDPILSQMAFEHAEAMHEWQAANEAYLAAL